MNLETTKAALTFLDQGEAFAWVTVLQTQGSAPRHAGAAMLVRAGGSITGTIGGGPLEAAAINRALEVIETGQSVLMEFDSAELGMACGGGGLVFIDYVDSARSAIREVLGGLLGLLSDGRRGWLVTLLPEGDDESAPVRRCLIDSDGSIIGDPVCAPANLRRPVESGGTYDRIVAGVPGKTHVQPVGTRGTAYVFGAGHCGQKLVPVLGTVGFFTVVVDDRGDFADRARFPTADRIVVPESFDGAVEALPIDEDSYVVILTRGHLYDKIVLEQALRTRAGYVGMIGSKKKIAGILQALREEGFSPDDIDRMYAPIGLPIGAETPEEIALSIAAELVQVRARKST